MLESAQPPLHSHDNDLLEKCYHLLSSQLQSSAFC